MAGRNRISARRPRGVDSGAHWISYSDMMASLLLVFVLAVCYSVYQYYNVLDIKTKELNEQQEELDKTQIILAQREEELETANVTLMGKQEELATIQIQLDTQQQELNAAQVSLNAAKAELEEKEKAQVVLQTALDEQATKLEAMQSLLTAQQTQLDRQKSELQTQQQKIDSLVGVRSQIILDLSSALSQANLRATVDATTGDIRLESQVFFETNSYQIKESGQELLNRFLPVYLSVLMRDEYKDYVGEIIIEGHTDTKGTYIANLELSQNRALSVAKYCLQMDTLSAGMKTELQEILTAKGRSYSDPIYNQDGTVNMDASRRVEFKFRLKDAEMIEEMNRILSEME